jgi:hypothetical protein
VCKELLLSTKLPLYTGTPKCSTDQWCLLPFPNRNTLRYVVTQFLPSRQHDDTSRYYGGGHQKQQNTTTTTTAAKLKSLGERLLLELRGGSRATAKPSLTLPQYRCSGPRGLCKMPAAESPLSFTIIVTILVCDKIVRPLSFAVIFELRV